MPKKPWKRNGDGDVVISLRTVKQVVTTLLAIIMLGSAIGIPIFTRSNGNTSPKSGVVELRAEFHGHEKVDEARMALILQSLGSIDTRLANLEARKR